MKNILLLIGILFTFNLGRAQHLTATHTRSVPNIGAVSATEYYLRKQQKEKELLRLNKQYLATQGISQQAIKARMLAVLYELFDLSMMKKQNEAEQLRGLLYQMESHQAYQQKSKEISQLKVQLVQVESLIEKRESLRDEIVARRLTDLTR